MRRSRKCFQLFPGRKLSLSKDLAELFLLRLAPCLTLLRGILCSGKLRMSATFDSIGSSGMSDHPAGTDRAHAGFHTRAAAHTSRSAEPSGLWHLRLEMCIKKFVDLTGLFVIESESLLQPLRLAHRQGGGITRADRLKFQAGSNGSLRQLCTKRQGEVPQDKTEDEESFHRFEILVGNETQDWRNYCPEETEKSRENPGFQRPCGGPDQRRTLTMILRMWPSPTIGACPSSGRSIVNCPGRTV